jgi:tetratricopeptide (TPR) repeat protein
MLRTRTNAARTECLNYNEFSIAGRCVRTIARGRNAAFKWLRRPLFRTLMNRSTYLPVVMVCFALMGMRQPAWGDESAEVNRLHRSGQTQAALQKADEFLASKPNDPQMRFLKGVMLADTRRGAEAMEVFQKISEDYPDLAEPYNNVAALHAAAGDYDKARAALEQALRLNPSYATAHENLGDVYAMLASRAYANTLRLEPSNPTAGPKLSMVREMFASRLGAAASAALPAAR